MASISHVHRYLSVLQNYSPHHSFTLMAALDWSMRTEPLSLGPICRETRGMGFHSSGSTIYC